jgi:cyclase
MALSTRIIPIILHRGQVMVKGINFKSWRSVGNALQAARIHARRGVDELMLLDVEATPARRPPMTEIVRNLTDDAFTPVTVGGGIRSLDDVDAVMHAGADKVCVCTAIFHTDVLERVALAYGSQAIVVSIDVADGQIHSRCGAARWNLKPESLARMVVDEGAGEIMINSIDRDGTMSGYDLPLIESIAKRVSVPVIAAGGCGKPEHMLEAINAGADAVAAASIFLFTDHTPRSCAEYLAGEGKEVRLC